MSNAFARLTSTLHVRHLHTTAYHPQANSKVESFHRFLGNVLEVGAYSAGSGINFP